MHMHMHMHMHMQHATCTCNMHMHMHMQHARICTHVQESDFQLEAALVPMDIKLPQKEGAAILKGMKLLQREVVKGAQQRRTLNAGGSLRVEFANELRGRGVPREAVRAAAALLP